MANHKLKEVWMITYDHKHGRDVILCDDESVAEREVSKIFSSYKFDFEYRAKPEELKSFNDAVNAKDLGKASEIWENVLGESICWDKEVVHNKYC